MNNWELNIINRIGNGLLLGWSYFEKEEGYEFYGLNYVDYKFNA